jgi:hypothetical protein
VNTENDLIGCSADPKIREAHFIGCSQQDKLCCLHSHKMQLQALWEH